MTRPTSDHVREAIFNMLGPLVDLDGAEVLDLFAGTGALGVEALSRGAAHVTFVERDYRARQAIGHNIVAVCGEAGQDQATVRSGDAVAWVATAGRAINGLAPDRPAPERPAAATGGYQVVFADPPYRFAGWPDLLVPLAAITSGVAVLESARPLELPPPGLPPRGGPGWEIVREKHYGGTVVTLAQPLPRRSTKGPT